MPGFDGTGPLGKGPMTGRGIGFCVLTSSEENPDQVKGFAGLQNVPVGQINGNFGSTGKEVINMPFGNGTGPAGLGPMTGRAAGFCAGHPVPGYMNPAGGAGWVNPAVGRAGFYGAGVPAFGAYGAGYGMPYGGYGMPYGGWGNPRLRRGFGFGRGWGRGRGRGRFGFRW
jgi:hypothetical protein